MPPESINSPIHRFANDNPALALAPDFIGAPDSILSRLPLAQSEHLPGEFFVDLEFFSGPMDLLLHLVEQQEVEIEKVDLSAVCNQYLKIVEQSSELDLDRAGEFLVVAATLVARKSEALLPRGNPNEITIGEDEGFDTRFFTELRQRLIAYKETKERAELLLHLPQLGIEEFSTKRSFVDPTADTGEFEEIRGESHELGHYFFNLLKRIGEAGRTFKIKLESITVVKYMVGLLDTLSEYASQPGATPRSFLDLVSKIKDSSSVKGRITGTFIATLELVKRGVVSVTGDSDNFQLSATSSDKPTLIEVSEFDAEEGSGESSSKIIEISRFQSPPETPVEEPVREEFLAHRMVVRQ